MQRAIQAIGSHGSLLKSAVLRHISAPKPSILPAVYSRSMSVSSAQIEESGFETATVADILKSKGKSADGSWLWCTTDDSVYDAVKSVCVFSFSYYLLSEQLCFNMIKFLLSDDATQCWSSGGC